ERDSRGGRRHPRGPGRGRPAHRSRRGGEMSTPAQERAFVLAESTANALTAARNSLSFAADAADEVDNVLRRSENDIDDLRSQSNRVRDADEPWRPVRNAQGLGQAGD